MSFVIETVNVDYYGDVTVHFEYEDGVYSILEVWHNNDMIADYNNIETWLHSDIVTALEALRDYINSDVEQYKYED